MPVEWYEIPASDTRDVGHRCLSAGLHSSRRNNIPHPLRMSTNTNVPDLYPRRGRVRRTGTRPFCNQVLANTNVCSCCLFGNNILCPLLATPFHDDGAIGPHVFRDTGKHDIYLWLSVVTLLFLSFQSSFPTQLSLSASSSNLPPVHSPYGCFYAYCYQCFPFKQNHGSACYTISPCNLLSCSSRTCCPSRLRISGDSNP